MILIQLAQETGLQPKWAASTQGGEYKSACPACGGKDRFSIQPNKQMRNCLGQYFCRQCDCRGDTIQFAREFRGLSFQEATQRANATITNNTNPLLYLPKKTMNEFEPISITAPSRQWIEKATALTQWAHQNLSKETRILEWLQFRGLPWESIQKYKIGYCPNDQWYEKNDWGITHLGKENKKIWIPKGIIIPTLNKIGNVIRLKVRRDEWHTRDTIAKYIAISGSMNGLSIIGDTDHKIMVVVESELDAYAIHYTVGDIVVAVAVGNNIKHPDKATNFYANNAEYLLISHDNDDAGKKMLDKWQSHYSHTKAYPTPFGKDIGEAIAQGLNIRQWILKHGWLSSPDLNLIEWVLNFTSKRTITRHAYTNLEKEIAFGSDSPRAKTGELQKGLQLMQKLIENIV